MRYFVTGATGFIGGCVAHQLVAAGHRVVALVRNPNNSPGLQAAGMTPHAGDITHRESMRAGMAGCDGVFHVEAFRLAQQITGISAPRVAAPAGALRGLAAAMGAVGRLIPLPDDLNAERLRVLAGVTYFGVSTKAQRELGFAARPLAEGLPETLAWEQKQIEQKQIGPA